MQTDLSFINARVAFEQAIEVGTLSDHPGSPIYAGRYMYMFTAPDGLRHAFKHCHTRQYVYADVNQRAL